MTLHHGLILFLAGAIAGAMIAVAGGGSFVSFPALMLTGVPAIPANATNTVALWLGIAASGGAYRKRLDTSRRVLVPLLFASVVGGALGAVLLLKTPAHAFLLMLPWLMLVATLLFAFGRRLPRHKAAGISHDASAAALTGACVFEFIVAIYGGYFGGGIGILIMPMLVLLGMTDIHAMNALRLLLSAVINGVAAATFALSGAVYWPQALAVTAGAILGGYVTAHVAQRLPQRVARAFVILVGTAVTIFFFAQAYR